MAGHKLEVKEIADGGFVVQCDHLSINGTLIDRTYLDYVNTRWVNEIGPPCVFPSLELAGNAYRFSARIKEYQAQMVDLKQAISHCQNVLDRL